ncbi:MAG: ATP-binding protein [Lachnospiraceae bacterium]|nr:ATP-binding protein [Lachnospiraceae bacterium]
MEIKRNRYLERLISRMNNGMIKVVTGIRRCGKTYLLFHLFYDHLVSSGVPEENIITVPLDDDDFAKYTDPEKLYEYIKSRIKDPEQEYYVFIDEAQYAITREEMKNPDVPIRLYGVLNGLLRKENVDVYVTGSNSKFLSSDIMTEFRGRGDEVHIAPLSFSEFLPAFGGDKMEAWKNYTNYGGMPRILLEKDDQAKSAYLDRLNKEIYVRDIMERYEIRNGEGMEELMKILASAIGSLTNAQKISDTFSSSGIKGITMPTISNYLAYLQESFIVQKAERYDLKGRKYIRTPAKYYYSDMGLRNAFLNFRQYEETHIMENVIYNELIYRGYNVDVGVVEARSEDGGRKQLEVDFVANQGSKRYYIQSAFAIPDQEKMDHEQASLIRISDSFKKIIVVNSNTPVWRNDQGILVMNLYDFLLNEESLDM